MIDILMSTFNGENFIAEQIESILQQDYTDFRVCIRDDASSDATIDIIREYARRDPRVNVVDLGSDRLGPSASFFALIEQSSAEYFMLADQDDVWLKNKISVTLKKLIDLETQSASGMPLAVFSDLIVVDEDLQEISSSFWAYQRLDPTISENWQHLVSQNVVTGCTLIANRNAREVILPFTLPSMMHDHWIAARVAKFGRLGYVSEPTVKYRQHARNVEGARQFGSSYAVHKFANLWRSIPNYKERAASFGLSTARLIANKVWLNSKRLI